MKRLSLLLVSICCVIISSCKTDLKQTQPTDPSTSSWSNISVAEAMNDNSSIFLDVRTPSETSEGIIDGALTIDVKNENFKAEVDKLDKSKTYIVYCRSGNRSQTASDIMVDLGFENVINMKGGYNAYLDSAR